MIPSTALTLPAAFPLPTSAVSQVIDLADGGSADLGQLAMVPLPEPVATSAYARRRQYAASRLCADAVLRRLGVSVPGWITNDADRVPVWPDGVVGSISHTNDLVWAAAMFSNRASAIGIDVEQIIAPARAAGVQRLICSDDEISAGTKAGLTANQTITLAFSSKESIYKAVFPFVRTFFGYRDARVADVDLESGVARIELTRDLPRGFSSGTIFDCRFALTDVHLFTSIAIGRDPGADPAPTREYDGD